MMLDIERDTLIRAIEPTCLSSQTYFELRPADLYLSFSVETAILVPGPIDVARLKLAIAHTLSAYPLYAGRIEKRCTNGNTRWLVRLSNEGALFDVVNSDEIRVVPSNTVVQAPFTLARKVDYKRHYSGSSDEPLLRVTLTRFVQTGQTVIGLSTAHVVGDGWVVYALLRSLSQKYQDINAPTVDICHHRPHDPAASSESVAKARNLWIENTYPIGTIPSHLDPTKSTPAVRVDFRLSATQLSDLRRGILEAAALSRGTNLVKISTQDALVAIVATAITFADVDSPPIRIISNTINHRGVEPMPATAVGNALLQTIGELEDDEDPTDAYALAAAVRRSLLQARNPDHAAISVALFGSKCEAAADISHGLDFSPGPGMMFVNSTRPFDWTSAHFGYPGRACFYHTVLNAPRYVKIFTPNPTPLPDGCWKDNTGAAEVVFYLQPHVLEPFKRAFREKVQELGVTGEVEFV